MNHNLSRNVFVDVAILPAAAGTGDTLNGNTIDTAAGGEVYESVMFAVLFGTLSAGAVTSLKIQSGQLANGSDMADIAGSSIAIPQGTGSNLGWLSPEVHRSTKRYLRVVVVRSVANAVVSGGFVMMGRAGSRPPVIGAAMGNVQPAILISP